MCSSPVGGFLRGNTTEATSNLVTRKLERGLDGEDGALSYVSLIFACSMEASGTLPRDNEQHRGQGRVVTASLSSFRVVSVLGLLPPQVLSLLLSPSALGSKRQSYADV